MNIFGNETQEQRLVKRLQNGDKAAAREFYALYGNSLAGVCARYIDDEEDLKDVFQNAFVSIFTHIADFKFQGQGSLKAWTTKVMVNESLKFLRKKDRHGLLLLEDMEEGLSDRLLSHIVDGSNDDMPPVSDIPPDRIRQMLCQLPTGYRTVLNLYVFEGKSHQEIARLLGIKESSSASQLHRARNLLAKMVRKYNNNNPPRQ